jgi:hypothetical protein
LCSYGAEKCVGGVVEVLFSWGTGESFDEDDAVVRVGGGGMVQTEGVEGHGDDEFYRNLVVIGRVFDCWIVTSFFETTALFPISIMEAQVQAPTSISIIQKNAQSYST